MLQIIPLKFLERFREVFSVQVDWGPNITITKGRNGGSFGHLNDILGPKQHS